MANEQVAEKPTRTADFIERYGHNVQFESSVWDLKIIFGSLDQSVAPAALRQNIAVTVPWVQAKLTLYYLYLNLLFHEAQNGSVVVPAAVMPPPIEAVLDGPFGKEPHVIELVERTKKMRADLFGLK